LPLKPGVKVAPVAMALFQSALLAMVTCALPAGWVNATGHRSVIRWLPGKSNSSVQPLVMASPVLVIATLAPKPLPLSQALLYWTEQPAAANAAAAGMTTAAPTTSAPIAPIATLRGGLRRINEVIRKACGFHTGKLHGVRMY